MSAKIFSTPKEIEYPTLSIRSGDTANEDIKAYNEAEDKFIDDVKQWLTDNGFTGKNAGEIIRFQVADGYALYMVVSMRPLKLMFLSLGDAYSFQYVENLTSKNVQQQIDSERAMAKLFS